MLDLGCGDNKVSGAIGLDRNDCLKDVDVLVEFKNRDYIPLRDDSFDEIHLRHFVEHVPDIAWLMSEIHHVRKNGAKVYLSFPHYSSRGSYSDVTHIHHLSSRAFEHFDPETGFGQSYGYYTHFGRYFPFRTEIISLSSNRYAALVAEPLLKVLGRNNFERITSRFVPINQVDLELRILKQ
ncbi:methyltransferase domain-containing protein [Candidatus Woesearchaeota archaeon]|nr:methyltransferase domain-containing protein [Candidatus Woesearchaeota archaeon]